ncbi:hypothetical protein CDAR_250701 [Caerostris darwini]|uniref:Uncharacterized protein n=1 Tax=Caerostris darwini TaxID=1538125 RepID=A0AAV4RTF2_9ARAC|nr:hypothetical protein CDAR_250701 [Caerostris darwini]
MTDRWHMRKNRLFPETFEALNITCQAGIMDLPSRGSKQWWTKDDEDVAVIIGPLSTDISRRHDVIDEADHVTEIRAHRNVGNVVPPSSRHKGRENACPRIINRKSVKAKKSSPEKYLSESGRKIPGII